MVNECEGRVALMQSGAAWPRPSNSSQFCETWTVIKDSGIPAFQSMSTDQLQVHFAENGVNGNRKLISCRQGEF